MWRNQIDSGSEWVALWLNVLLSLCTSYTSQIDGRRHSLVSHEAVALRVALIYIPCSNRMFFPYIVAVLPQGSCSFPACSHPQVVKYGSMVNGPTFQSRRYPCSLISEVSRWIKISWSSIKSNQVNMWRWRWFDWMDGSNKHEAFPQKIAVHVLSEPKS